MILLDTNVISEFTKPMVSAQVATWFQAHNSNELGTTAITEAEIFAGLVALPDGKRKIELMRETHDMLFLLSSRIFAFDRDAAHEFARVVFLRRAAGMLTDMADGQIAAIARVHGASVATRNVRHFDHTGVEIINPWTA